MSINVGKEVAALQRMTVRDLRAKYAETFGEETNANNKAWLLKRIAWRIQALAGGTLSDRAKQRAAELANDADVRTSPPRAKATPVQDQTTKAAVIPLNGDCRVPPPGSVIIRIYKGHALKVLVLTDGFEFEGERYKSLSAVAKAVTGQHCNGFLFFQLAKEGGR